MLSLHFIRHCLPWVFTGGQATDCRHVNGSGIRDTARVLDISRTVIETLKDRHLKAVNEVRLAQLEPTQTIVKLCQWQDLEVEVDGVSSVQRNSNVGCGTRLTMARAKHWRMCCPIIKIVPSWHSKHC